MPQVQPPRQRLRARSGHPGGIQAADRLRGFVACDEEQLACQLLGCGLRRTTAGERVQQRMTSEVLERAAAAQEAAEPMGQEVIARGA
jgi:hypothetical protein